MVKFKRSRTPSEYIYYALHLYFSSLSLRKTSEHLLPFVKRNHVSIWNWIQHYYKPTKVWQKKRTKISQFIIINETVIRDLDRTDLVFINPVGTGYSTAIAPGKNKDFWGVDQDAKSIRQFIKRYLTVYGRWNSPKFLFGESYWTPRTCVLTWLLHEGGVDLNGVVPHCASNTGKNTPTESLEIVKLCSKCLP